MVNTIQYNQSNFNRGEIDPLLGARFDYEDYDKSLKAARNAITLPQGAITSRFGTEFIAAYGNIDPTQIELTPILYNDDTTFLVVFYPSATPGATVFDVWVENTLFQSGISISTYKTVDLGSLKFSQAGNQLVITNENFPPAYFTLGSASNTVTAASSTILTTGTSSLTIGQVFPVIFTSGSLTSSPQLYLNRTYWGLATATNQFALYETAADAANNENNFSFTGSPSSLVMTQYTSWALSNITISTYPSFDFSNGSYLSPSFTFTPSAVSGTVSSTVTITASGSIFTSAHVGGLFTGNGGVLRITAVGSATTCSGYTISPFAAAAVIAGQICFLGQPAWDATHGYPRCSSTFQGRLFFAGSPALPNGIWGSIVNEYSNFDDSESFPDNAISYYPGSGNITYIQSMSAARSLLIHTNTGSFSTALSTEQPLTPTNVSFTEQNKDGASAIQPVFIDNQVIYIDKSYNNVKNLIWELSQSSYILRNISIVSSSLIRKPVDSANYSNPLYIDGSYVLVVNGDGTLATFNTLYMENVAGWTLQNSEQWVDSQGVDTIPSPFIHVCSSFERVWFLVNRQLYALTSSSTATIVNNTTKLVTMLAAYTINSSQVWRATIGGDATQTNYYATQSAASNFTFYATYEDALNRTSNTIIPPGVVVGSSLQFYCPYNTVCLEELDFNHAKLDSWSSGSISGGTFTFDNSAAAANYNGQWVYYYVPEGDAVLSDGDTVPLGYSVGPIQILNGTFTVPNIPSASVAYIGFPFTTNVTFLPININLVTGNNFYKPKLVRQFYLYYYNTVAARVNGIPFGNTDLDDMQIGAPTVPGSGIFTVPPMVGWEPLEQDITITQTGPNPLTILGYSAAVEVV